jgi:hypothetical protein
VSSLSDEINRRITPEEYELVVARAEELGFENLYLQPSTFEPDDHFLPDFEKNDPFSWRKHNP